MRRLVRDRLDALHRKTVRQGKDFEQLPMEARHRLRKRLKRLRYLAELTRPLFPAAAVDGYVSALKDLQEALGHYQDAAAGRALLLQRTGDDPAAWFGVGWLRARDDALAAACQKACRRTARKARRFWA
jgi:triphosphatase